MRWYKDKPEVGDFVVVTVEDVDKNSAYADLDEYKDLTGLLHISEVSRSWVQDVSKELDEGEKTVAQVIDIDGDSIDLSLKRVNDTQKRRAMEKWNKEKKAEKFVEELKEELGMSDDEIFEEIIFPLQEEFGSTFTAFEMAIGAEETLQEMFEQDVIETIQDVARENINLKQEKLEGEIKLAFNSPDGVSKIKEAFKDLEEGIEVKYVSAPTYSITAYGRNQELAKDRMDTAVETVRERVENLDGKFEFTKA